MGGWHSFKKQVSEPGAAALLATLRHAMALGNRCALAARTLALAAAPGSGRRDLVWRETHVLSASVESYGEHRERSTA